MCVSQMKQCGLASDGVLVYINETQN